MLPNSLISRGQRTGCPFPKAEPKARRPPVMAGLAPSGKHEFRLTAGHLRAASGSAFAMAKRWQASLHPAGRERLLLMLGSSQAACYSTDSIATFAQTRPAFSKDAGEVKSR